MRELLDLWENNEMSVNVHEVYSHSFEVRCEQTLAAFINQMPRSIR